MSDRGMFLDLIEQVQTDSNNIAATFSRMTQGDGASIRTTAERRQAADRAAYAVAFQEAATLIREVVTGKRPSYHLKEALSTSDFPLLFGDVLDRTLLGAYRTYPTTYQTWTRRKVNRDFRQARLFTLEGGDDTLEPVAQGTEYPETSLVEGDFNITVAKRGRRMPSTWETIINDDLDALTDIPQRFGRAAARGREKQATGLFYDANGLHATFFSAANDNLADAPFGEAGLNAAITTMLQKVDAVGEPIVINGFFLHVPPALWITADRVLRTTEVRFTGTNNELRIVQGNGIGANLTLVRNPYFASLNPDPATRDTTWALTADPGEARPSFMYAVLRGHEEPEVFIKEANARRVGGGAVSPLDGDFDTDSIHYKVRDVFGTARIDAKFAYASTGDGS